jgi:chorismate mutase
MALASSVADALGMQTRFDTLPPFATSSFLSELQCTFRSRHLRRVSEQGFMCLEVLPVRRIDVSCCPFPRCCRRAVIVDSYSMSQPIYHPQCHQARSESRDLAK